MKRRLLLSLVPGLLLFGLAELTLRVLDVGPRAAFTESGWIGAQFAGRFPLTRDDDLFWRLPPGAVVPDSADTLNAMGFRGPSLAADTTGRSQRMILIGDSNTFGSGVSQDATFAHRLRRWLAAGETRWEVLNAGVPGYSAFQMRRWFALRGRAMRPDVVVLYAGAWNDFAPAIGFDDEAWADRMASRGSLLDRSRLYQVLVGLLVPSRAAEATVHERYIRGYAEAGIRPDGPRVSEAKFRSYLEDLVQQAHATGARVVLVVPPAPATTRGKYPASERYAEIVREVGRTAADAVVDARQTFIDLGDEDGALFGDFIHPSPAGHGLIALSLARELTGMGIAELPPDGVLTSAVQVVDLREHAAGEPLPEACPGRIAFAGVTVPRQGSLFFAPGYVGDRAEGLPRQAVVTVSVGESGAGATEVFRQQLTGTGAMLRVDLAAWSAREVVLELAVTGTAGAFVWGDPQLHPFR